jgi:predicted Rossmann fold flavoprotein
MVLCQLYEAIMKKITQSNIQYDVIVIGGGASGMMAANVAAEQGKKVLLIEKNKKLGEKLAISGGGRCNITNAEKDERILLSKYGSAEKFLYSTFAQFGMEDTFEFFKAQGLPLIVEANKRAFPETEKAADVVRVLRNYMTKQKVEVHLGKPVERFIIKGGRIQSVVAGSESFFAESYILATGGVSHPETGSTGDGFIWLKELGHTVRKPTPTIVPLAISEKWFKELSGTTLTHAKCSFYLSTNGEVPVKKFGCTGNILITHFGLSGPTILNTAGKVADLLYEGAVTAHIDLYPKVDIGTLDAEMVEIFSRNKNKALRTVLKELMPKGIVEAVLEQLAIDPERKVHSVTKDVRRKIIDFIKEIPVTVTGLMDFDRAVIADGGVPLTEMDMKTMRSEKIQNLFITGDLLDISRPSGGYSLQLCWTTGFVAGRNA